MKNLKRIVIGIVLLSIGFSFYIYQGSSNPKENRQNDRIEKPLVIKGLEQNETIKIGVYQPLSGIAEPGGTMELRGIKIAHDIYPEVNGHPIELVIKDNQSRRDEVVNIIASLIDEDKVKAIIGSWGSDYAIAAVPLIEAAKIPTIGASCSSPQITIGNEYYSRVCNIDPVQAKAMANFVISNYRPKRVAILVDSASEYSRGLSEYFRESFIDLNGLKGSSIKEFYFTSGDIDFRNQVDAMKLLGADVVYMAGNYLDGIEFIKSAKDNNLNIPILGPDTWDTPEFNLRGGPVLENVIFSSFYSPDQSMSHELAIFRKKYFEIYNEEPASFAVLGYDAYLLLYYSIKKSGSIEHSDLNNTIQSTTAFSGAVGSMTIDKNGDANRPIFIKQVKDNGFITLNVYESK